MWPGSKCLLHPILILTYVAFALAFFNTVVIPLCCSSPKKSELFKTKLSQQKSQLELSVFQLDLRNIEIIDRLEETGITIQRRYSTDNLKGYLHCRDFHRLKQLEHFQGGFTKTVYKAKLDGKTVIYKTVGAYRKNVKDCIAGGTNSNTCLLHSDYNVMKEIALLQQLHHPNIIKMLGFCVPPTNSSRYSMLVTEYGKPLTLILLLQSSWENRLRICTGIMNLVTYLTNAETGSMIIRDFKLSQFALVDGEIKLVDLDDLDNVEPEMCLTDRDCNDLFPEHPHAYPLRCVANTCRGYNEKLNLLNSYRLFFKDALLPGTPAGLVKDMKAFISDLKELKFESYVLKERLDSMLRSFQSGRYLATANITRAVLSTDFKTLYNHDLPGRHDYMCSMSHIGSESCTLSAFDIDEAKFLCLADKNCRAFVWTSEKTWTGRTVIYLKNGSSNHVPSSNTDLYIRQSTNKYNGL